MYIIFYYIYKSFEVYVLTNSLQQLWKTAGRVGIKVGNLGYLARDISPNGKKNLLVLIYSKLHSKSYDYLYK